MDNINKAIIKWLKMEDIMLLILITLCADHLHILKDMELWNHSKKKVYLFLYPSESTRSWKL